MAPPVENGGRPLRVLAIGDPHERALSTTLGRSRWVALGRFVCRQKPDVIVWIGDHWDLPCLSDESKSRGGRGISARVPKRTFLQEIQAGKDAIQAFLNEIQKHNRRASRNGRGEPPYEPRLVFCMGNHEMRINTAGGELEEFVDFLDVDHQIGNWLRERGFEVVPFLRSIRIGGVYFVHYIPGGSKRYAIPIHHAARMIGRSAVWGHTHLMGYDERQNPSLVGGEWDKWLCLPTFKDPAHLEKGQVSAVVMLDDVFEGNFTHALISTDRLLREYGPLPA